MLQTVVAAGYPGSDIRGDTNVVTPNTVVSQGEVSVLQRQSNNLVLVLHTAKMSTGSSGEKDRAPLIPGPVSSSLPRSERSISPARVVNAACSAAQLRGCC